MNDAERWDGKYASATSQEPGPCEPLVLEALDRIEAPEAGRALDLAAGLGRHALELANRGWITEAWDVSSVGLERLAKSAARADLEVLCRTVDLTADLPPVTEAFDLLLMVNYLDRRLAPRLLPLLRPGGRVLFCTFTTDRQGSHPSDRHCLKPGELESGLPGLRSEEYREEQGRALLVARLD